jgi:hypothetical protein
MRLGLVIPRNSFKKIIVVWHAIGNSFSNRTKKSSMITPKHLSEEHDSNECRFEGICRIFNVSMPYLLGFFDEVVATLPENLNAQVVREDDDIEVVLLEADEQ